MVYTSDNGYTGIMRMGNFSGMKHWDFTIFDKDGKMVYHATLSSPYSVKKFKEKVDNFPDTYELLCSLSRKADKNER